MTRFILTYGVVAGIALEALFLGTMTLGLGHGTLAMAVGFLSMIAGMGFVFAGVKRYRDEQLGGVIRFLPAWGLGTAMALIAALFYVAGWEAYLAATGYAYVDAIVAMGYPDYGDPLSRLPMTFMEISPVVLLVPLISALLLKNSRFLPARPAA